MIRCLTAAAVMMLMISCKKKAVKVDGNFAGRWKQFGVYVISEITISEKGKSTYYGAAGEEVNRQQGVAKVDRKTNTLYVGMKKWKIDAYPCKDNDVYLGAVWKMTLDGIGHCRSQ